MEALNRITENEEKLNLKCLYAEFIGKVLLSSDLIISKAVFAKSHENCGHDQTKVMSGLDSKIDQVILKAIEYQRESL